MERTKETIVKELEMRISIWRERQSDYCCDEEFFHYSQRYIDRLEEKLDKISRLENWNEYLSI